MVLIIDAQVSGIAGNMFIGSLLDLGASSEKTMEVMKTYAKPFGKIEIELTHPLKAGIKTTQVHVKTIDKKARKYNEIIEKIDEITKENYLNDKIIEKTIKLSKKIFKTIQEAESTLHNKDINELHFHEVGTADAIADVIGATYAYHLLGLDKEKVYSLPVSVGSGQVKTQHGLMPVPAPATNKILENVPIIGGPINKELATPTGAAILVNITDEYIQHQPITQKRKTGYGAGTLKTDTLNALRLIHAQAILPEENLTILETNVDTVTGEILGGLFDKLLNAKARDVTITPIIMKKNRPGHLIKIITKPENADNLTRILMEETGTLGVRVIPYAHRSVAHREIKKYVLEINGKKEEIQFKVGSIQDKIIKHTPEYEDIKKIAYKRNMPIKDVMDQAQNEYIKKYGR
ncbi:MAG: nickel pincer cofactor biosynthesis protein LarC [Methanobacteriaceae archaeon]|nr:nickel pincer cofactor biosynthesis protein LarC [Methanobacteriaceae archaeon]